MITTRAGWRRFIRTLYRKSVLLKTLERYDDAATYFIGSTNEWYDSHPRETLPDYITRAFHMLNDAQDASIDALELLDAEST